MQKSLSSHDLTGKSIILRLDLDVPIKNGVVADNTRLKTALPSLKYCLAHAKKTILIGHLGRPEGEDQTLSLKPIMNELKRLINQDILWISSLSEAGKWRNGTSPLGLL